MLKNREIFNQKDILLDIGCGENKQPGFVGMDYRPLPGVDIVHDLLKFPYPLLDESCKTIVGSHIVEHIPPMPPDPALTSLINLLLLKGIISNQDSDEYIGDFDHAPTFIRFMEELWRITKVGGQVAFAYPYGVGTGFQQDPTHCNIINQATWHYFDPRYPLYDVYKLSPWKIETNVWQETGQGEVLLRKLSKSQGEDRLKERLEDNKNNVARLEEKNKEILNRNIDDKVVNQLAEARNQKPQESPREMLIGNIIKNKEKVIHRLLYGVPMTGLIRSEWAFARYNQIIPCNWTKVDMLQFLDQWSPLGFTVADARNIIATAAVEQDFEWLFFHDHDVILPQGTLIKLNQYMISRKYPVVSGLYFTKSMPSEPLIYRGKGTGYYKDWKFGDKVWIDNVPMGCTLIHVSILKAMYDESESYVVSGQKVKKIFETPAKMWYDAEKDAFRGETGTEDIHWCNRVITERFFDKAGWPEYQEKEFPMLMDTSLFCKHITFEGLQYPLMGEEFEFEPERLKNPTVTNDSKDAMS